LQQDGHNSTGQRSDFFVKTPNDGLESFCEFPHLSC
jgi:hypothetical protein